MEDYEFDGSVGGAGSFAADGKPVIQRTLDEITSDRCAATGLRDARGATGPSRPVLQSPPSTRTGRDLGR